MPDALTPEVRAALDQCRDIITKGSKSFSLAAKLFDPQVRDAAVFPYGWYRYCDDQVDEGWPLGTWFGDVDVDLYGDAAASVSDVCQPDGYVADSTGRHALTPLRPEPAYTGSPL